MMTTRRPSANEIRKRFLDFFESKGHAIIASDSVVPKDDPTVLFTTAGMQQFKRQFLGQGVTYKRAATCQKCLRTDDLDKVGKTPFHHTFFEMLGNFSFGDYFKEDAIKWAWEFLTKELKIPKEKLWVSVYEDDSEAEKIWLENIEIPKSRLIRLGDKSNFWPAEAKTKGPDGPCGPCSEIFFDYGVNPECKNKNCDPTCDCGRFSEVWNLVFTQFNRREGGVLESLPGKNIDTGMGLERLVAVVQGKKSNYETDLFEPIIKYIAEVFSNISETDARIIADHMRAIVFAIGDGVVPSNKERGFVVKKLITTVSDIFLRHTDDQTYVHKFVSHVAAVMKDAYPILENKIGEIEGYVRKTEDDHKSVFITQIPELKTRIWDIGQTNQSREQKIAELGKLFFFFRDTYGLSISTIKETAVSSGVTEKALVEIEDIEKALESQNQLMEEQKNRSRAASKMTGDVFTNKLFNLALAGTAKTKFVGYDQMKAEARVLQLLSDKTDGEELLHIHPDSGEVKIILDETPFYAESGGQIGDTGYLINEKATIRILDTKKQDDIYIHIGRVERGSLDYQGSIGAIVTAQVDEERRLAIMRNHTATHLLQAALRKILGSHVQQQGSLVAEDRLRFDFTHPQAVNKEQLNKIESLVNGYIQADDRVEKHVMPLEEAKKSGALAFFAEKYGDTVRVVSIGGYSKEFCGGTHLNQTGEIGPFKITNEGAIAQGIRRLEAVTGTYVRDWVKNKDAQEQIRLKSAQQKQREKHQSEMNFEKIKNSIDAIIKESKNIKTVNLIRHHFKNVEPELLRKISDLIKQKVKSAVIALTCENNGNANILIVVTEDLIKKEIKANDIIKEVAPLIGGSGGGRPELAQAGSKDATQLEAALKRAEDFIKTKT